MFRSFAQSQYVTDMCKSRRLFFFFIIHIVIFCSTTPIVCSQVCKFRHFITIWDRLKLIGGIEVLQQCVVFLIPRVDFLYCWMSHLSLCFLKGVHKGKFWECLQSTINKHNRNFNHKPDQETCQRQASFLMPQPFFDSCCDVHSRIAIFHSFTFTPINLLPIKPNSSKFYQAYLYEWNLSLRIKQSSIKLTTVNLSIQLTSIKLTAIQLPSVQLACLFFCHLCLTEPISVPNPPSPITYKKA